MSVVVEPSEKLEPGDWVVDHPRFLPDVCYEVRGIEGEYVKLRAFHIPTKQRFNCTSALCGLSLIRKKDGRRISPAMRCG